MAIKPRKPLQKKRKLEKDTKISEPAEKIVKKVKTKKPKKTSKPKLIKNLISLKSYEPKIKEISKKYKIPIEVVEANTANIIKLVEENPKLKNTLFTERFPIFLQLNVFKIPNCQQPKLMRIDLEHSLLDTDDEICLIVPDVKGMKNKEYEPQVEHYEEILKQNDVKGIKKIMTLHQLRAEYDTFELKRGLVELYDLFLVDGRISGRVVHHLGKIFYNKRKIPTPIKIEKSKMKSSYEKALKKSAFQVHSKGDSFMVQIGHSKMSERELVENVFTAVESLDKIFPGGVENFQTINLFAQRGSSLPIYVSIANPNDIKVPKLKVKRPKLHKDVEGELTTQFNHVVKVKPSGHIIMKQVSCKDD